MFEELLKRRIPAHIRLRLRALLEDTCERGLDSYVHPSVHLLGGANIKIGSNSCISEQTWFNVNRRQPGAVAISIGNHCFVGRRNFFSSGKSIFISDYVLTANDCRFICSTHITDDPLVPYIMSGTTTTDEIRVGCNCFFGTGAVVLGNVHIGHGSVVGASALVTGNVPPFSVVVGNPAVVLKRYSFLRKQWLMVERVQQSDLLSNPDEEEYLAMLMNRNPYVDLPLIAAGRDLGNL